MIDVSGNNHDADEPINWSEVSKSGLKAVMIKATQADNYTNPWLLRDAHGANAAGLEVGYYHFAEPGKGSAAEQASYLLKAIDGLPHSLGVCLDFETLNGLTWPGAEAWIKQFLDIIPHAPTFVNKTLYINQWYLSNLPGAPYTYNLWLAAPGPTPPRRHVWAWQNSWTGDIPGIPGNVDTDILYV